MQDDQERFEVGAGLTIVGDVDAAGSLRVGGSVRGRVFVRGTLEIAPGGVVEGFVQALDIDVHGRLAGVVRAAAEVRLHPDGQVSGDVEAPRVRFVKADTPSLAPPPPAAAAPVEPPPPVARTAAPVALAAPPPTFEEDERPALPPAHAGQASGPLPPWPPQGLPKAPPVWAPRSARPASAPPPPDPEAEAAPPPPPSITGAQRQIVVKRK